MGKIVKPLLWILGFVGVLLAVGAVALTVAGVPKYDVVIPDLEVDDSPKRVAAGRRLATMICFRCHYDTNEHKLSGLAMDDVPRRFGIVNASNITRNSEHGIGAWSDGELAFALRTGIGPRSGELMMPRMPRFPRMATEDLESIVAFMRSDAPAVQSAEFEREAPRTTLWTKFFAYTQWEPYVYPKQVIPTPDLGDPVAVGEYLVNAVLQCHVCHSEVLDEAHFIEALSTPGYLGGGAPMVSVVGEPISAANLTPHATGIGDWSLEELRRALVDGFGRDNEVLRWPMRRYSGLTVSEVEAIYVYLQTVPPIDNAIERLEIRTVGPKSDLGMHVYQRYGCSFCHGATGVGLVDMRGVDETFPTDEELIAFLRDPAKTFPETPMPAWDTVVAEEDYPALCEITRRLSRANAALVADRERAK